MGVIERSGTSNWIELMIPNVLSVSEKNVLVDLVSFLAR